MEHLRHIHSSEDTLEYLPISEELIEAIAEKAAEKALEKMENRIYQTVGKTFINKLFQFIGVILVSVAIYLNHKGILKF